MPRLGLAQGFVNTQATPRERKVPPVRQIILRSVYPLPHKRAKPTDRQTLLADAELPEDHVKNILDVDPAE
jgi:hypothetical protein